MNTLLVIICILLISAVSSIIIMKCLDSFIYLTPALHAQQMRRQHSIDDIIEYEYNTTSEFENYREEYERN